jgi:tyrosinase
LWPLAGRGYARRGSSEREVIVADIVLRPDAADADVAALRDAYGKMQELSPTDNRSWVYWAEFHGFNRYDCWHHSRVGPGSGSEFAYDLFLPWHRAYLAYFDHVTRDQNEGAILPWWDWTSELSHQEGVPSAYAEAEVDGERNPLASGPTPDMPGDAARFTRRFPGDPSELPLLDGPNPPAGFNLGIKQILDLTQYEDFSNQLQDVHDGIHGWTGGMSPDGTERGDMGSISSSAFDPIFWAHHAMIDRLWYLWQLDHGVNNIPADYLGRVLAPFPFTVREVLDVRTLGYDYAVASAVTVTAGGGG